MSRSSESLERAIKTGLRNLPGQSVTVPTVKAFRQVLRIENASDGVVLGTLRGMRGRVLDLRKVGPRPQPGSADGRETKVTLLV